MLSFKKSSPTSYIMFAALGSMIGGSWLFCPLYAAQMAGPAALVSWFISFILILLMAYPLCGLAIKLPHSKGLNHHVEVTHNSQLAFMFYFVSWLSFVVIPPMEVMSVVQYLGVYQTSLVTKIEGQIHLTTWGYVLAISLLFTLSILNSYGSAFVLKFNKWLTSFKIFILILILCFFFSSAKHWENINLVHTNFSSYETWSGILHSIGFAGVIFALTGFQNALSYRGQIENNKLPKAIFAAIFIGFLLYLLLQMSFLVALPQSLMQGNFSQISFPGESGPLVGLGLVLGLGFLVKLIFLNSLLAPYSTAMLYTSANTNTVFQFMQSEKYFSEFKGASEKKIHAFIIAFNFIFGLLMFLPFPGWQKMISFLSSALVFGYLIGPICYLRVLNSLDKVPLKSKLFTYLSFVSCNLALLWCGFDVLVKICIALSVAFFIYAKGKKSTWREKVESMYFIAYFYLLTIVSYEEKMRSRPTFQGEMLTILFVAFMSVVFLFLYSLKQLDNREYVVDLN